MFIAAARERRPVTMRDKEEARLARVTSDLGDLTRLAEADTFLDIKGVDLCLRDVSATGGMHWAALHGRTFNASARRPTQARTTAHS